MSIESEVFKKERLNKVKLEQYGFVKENDEYKYSKNFMHDNFRADIVIDKNGKVSGKVFDLEVNEEYTSFRIESVVGEFVNRVKKEYINILKDIAVKCFEKQYFVNDQSNRITKLIKEKYDVEPEFLWEKFPNYAVFRNARSEKWFGAIMDIDRSKIIPNQEGDTEILDIKLDDETEKYLKYRGIYPAYHMSKKSWITIILDDSLKDEEILKLIDISFQSSNVKGEWIIPANPKYYDVIGAFEHSD
ncbi:MAG: MmcQ/YjbR family DNA-binding protein, partial [Intestinibacter sp.]